MVSRAVIAGLMTVIVFVSGFSVGMLWDSLRANKLQANLDEISVYSTSLFLESQLLDELNCPAFLPVIQGALEDISESLDDYLSYSDASLFEIDSKRTIYRKYLLSNIRYWTLSERYREQCGWNASIVLFFFDEYCKAPCDSMGSRLDFLKKTYEDDLLIFPINLELAKDDPVALTLLRMYNVTSYPALVIDGMLVGEIPLEDLEGLVCQRLSCSE
ncbi:MAG: thioredoxin [Candidatus Altiarchaeota archaeon]|nr:thioredoxin [Candidatus Altiarchaeota archaeon]